MKTKIQSITLLSMLLAAGIAQQSHGAWQLIADFDSEADLAVVSDRTNREGSEAKSFVENGRLVVDPGVQLTDTSNIFSGINLGADLRAASVAADKPVTVYFEMIQPTVSDGQGGTRKSIVDIVFGLYNNQPDAFFPSAYNAFNMMGRINFANDSLELRDGSAYVVQTLGGQSPILQADVAYKFWVLVDFAFNEYSAFVQGGQWAEPTQMVGTDDEFLGFRQNPGFKEDLVTPQVVDQLVIALSAGNIAAPKSLDPILIDNVYVDVSGENKTDPVGPAKTWAGYPMADNGYVDTGSFLGPVVVFGDFLFVFAINNYMYMPEDFVGSGGAWGYVFR